MARTDFGALATSPEHPDFRRVRRFPVSSFHRMSLGRMRNPYVPRGTFPCSSHGGPQEVFHEERIYPALISFLRPLIGRGTTFRRAHSLRASGRCAIRASVPWGTHLRHQELDAWRMVSWQLDSPLLRRRVNAVREGRHPATRCGR
jgi:hypothetical protein